MQEEEKLMFIEEVERDVAQWAGPDFDPKNIRALLQGFHTIWKHDQDKWTELGFQDILSAKQVRKCYRKGARRMSA